MQDNTAYNMAQLNKYASSENVYDTPRREDVKSIAVHKTKKGRFRVGCFALLSMFAITFATTAVLLSLVQLTLMLTQEKQMQEAVKEAIDAFRFEYSSMQGNISDQLKELLDLIKASNIQLSTTMTTAATITTTTSSLEVCGGPGWRRIAFINMTDPNQNCPQGLTLTDYSIRSCGRTHTENLNCSTVTFPVDDTPYNKVCGRATAYRWGDNFAFAGYNQSRETINGAYVDGLSLTHGSPRTHIWTFASGFFNGTGEDAAPNFRCPCDPGNTHGSPPFVGNDYFCDSVAIADNDLRFYPNNALWDGRDLLNPCYGLNSPPWFNKTLPEPTTDDIELRMCFSSDVSASNIAIEKLELYVQ